MLVVRRSTTFLPVLLALAFAAACGGGGGSGGGGSPVTEPDPQPSSEPGGPSDPGCTSGASYDGTFEAIQQVIFERHGCTQDACHGSARSGGAWPASRGTRLRPSVCGASVKPRRSYRVGAMSISVAGVDSRRPAGMPPFGRITSTVRVTSSYRLWLCSNPPCSQNSSPWSEWSTTRERPGMRSSTSNRRPSWAYV